MNCTAHGYMPQQWQSPHTLRKTICVCSQRKSVQLAYFMRVICIGHTVPACLVRQRHSAHLIHSLYKQMPCMLYSAMYTLYAYYMHV